MSLLLDALNRADQERKRNEATPGIDSNHEQRLDDEPRQNPVLFIAAIVVGILILAAIVYWLGQRSAAPVSSATNTSSAAKTVTANSAPSNAEKKVEVVEPTPEVENAPAPDESVTSLYQQTQVPETNTAITISTPQPDQAQAAVDPAPAPEAAPPPTEPTSITQYTNMPELHNLQKDILEKVPTLTYSEHHYDVNDSSVKINGHIFHVNEQIAGGITIDRILPDGIILNIEGHPFKMRAMNSWINM